MRTLNEMSVDVSRLRVRLRSGVAGLSILPLLMTGAATSAQDIADQEESRINLLMEEVVVTARKREEGLQSAPIAISAFSGESLEVRGITTLNDIQSVTPNLTFYNYTTEGGSTNNASIFIRGEWL